MFLFAIFQNNSKLQQMLPKLQNLELTFNLGFRNKFYAFFFPGLSKAPNIRDDEIFPQIRNLTLTYPGLGLDNKYLGWTQAVAKMFPNVHNKYLNYARSRPEANVDNYDSSD